MEWIDRLNQAVAYIEAHLTDEIDYGQLAQITCCSTYHFQRMFAYIANVTLTEYIRRRKMTKAVVDLQKRHAKVIDVAIAYGYNSPTAFNRAFQSVHGVPPSQAKTGGAIFKSYPPISFKVTIRGDAELEYRIEKKQAFRIVGVSTQMHGDDLEKEFEIISALWRDVSASGALDAIQAMADTPDKHLRGACTWTAEKGHRYYLAVVCESLKKGKFEEFIIPAATYAIFSGSGVLPGAMQELERKIFTEWLPTSGYDYGNGTDMEVYVNSTPHESLFELWIPVTKNT